MSDRTYFQISILVFDPHQVGLILAELDVAGVNHEYEPPGSPDRLTPGDTLVADEVALGTGDTLSAALVQADPTIVFECWEDPKYEWLGSYFAHIPDLGLHTGCCDAGGQPVITDVAGLLLRISDARNADAGPDAAVDSLASLEAWARYETGADHRARIEWLRTQLSEQEQSAEATRA